MITLVRRNAGSYDPLKEYINNDVEVGNFVIN